MERQLLKEFEELIEQMIPNMAPHTLSLLCELAAAPQSIRGYGHVKHRNFLEVKARMESLQKQLWEQIAA